MPDGAPRSRPALVDPRLEASFVTDGYVVVDLFDPDEIAELRAIFDRLCPDRSAQFLASNAHPDRAYPIAVDREVRPIVAPVVQRHLDRYRPIFAAIAFKARGDINTVDLHQDWTFVDESRFRAVLLWAPLIDTNVTNGTLHVVPGSHTTETLRGSGAVGSVFAGHERLILDQYFHPVPLRAGQGVLYDGALLHGSTANRTAEGRPAVGLVSAPEEAAVVHYCAGEPGTLERFEVDARFFTEAPFMQRPEGYPSLGQVAYDPLPLTRRELVRRLRPLGHRRGGPLARRTGSLLRVPSH